MKRTPWFSTATRPVRVGVYETRIGSQKRVMRRVWDGRTWRYETNGEESTWFGAACGFPEDSWRGVLREEGEGAA